MFSRRAPEINFALKSECDIDDDGDVVAEAPTLKCLKAPHQGRGRKI